MLSKQIEADRHAHSQIASFLVSEGYSYRYNQEFFYIDVEDTPEAIDQFESFKLAFGATEVTDK